MYWYQLKFLLFNLTMVVQNQKICSLWIVKTTYKNRYFFPDQPIKTYIFPQQPIFLAYIFFKMGREACINLTLAVFVILFVPTFEQTCTNFTAAPVQIYTSLYVQQYFTQHFSIHVHLNDYKDAVNSPCKNTNFLFNTSISYVLMYQDICVPTV
jgi:hypothetical protein